MNRTQILPAALILGALTLGTVVNSALPSPDDIFSQPFPRAVSLNEPAHLRTGTVIVSGVQGSQNVTALSKSATTSGVWLVTSLSFEALADDKAVTSIEVVAADGRRYGGTQAVGISPACGASNPGIPVYCQVAIEVASDAVPGAHFVVHNYDSAKSDDYADVDLGITKAAADAMRANTAFITITPSRYGSR